MPGIGRRPGLATGKTCSGLGGEDRFSYRFRITGDQSAGANVIFKEVMTPSNIIIWVEGCVRMRALLRILPLCLFVMVYSPVVTGADSLFTRGFFSRALTRRNTNHQPSFLSMSPQQSFAFRRQIQALKKCVDLLNEQKLRHLLVYPDRLSSSKLLIPLRINHK